MLSNSPPLESPIFCLYGDCLQDLRLLRLNLWVIFRFTIHITEDLQSLVVPSMLVKKTRRFRKAKDKRDDDLQQLDIMLQP